MNKFASETKSLWMCFCGFSNLTKSLRNMKPQAIDQNYHSGHQVCVWSFECINKKALRVHPRSSTVNFTVEVSRE